MAQPATSPSATEFAGNSRDVADPWYTGDFDTTYEDVCDGCEGLLNYLAPRM